MIGNPLLHVRRTARRLVRHPGFSLPVILMLALGIGSSTAIFSVIYSSWLRPLPYPEADRLVRIFEFEKDHQYPTTTVDYLALAESARGFEGIAAHTSSGYLLAGDTEAGLIRGASVTPNFFQVLGRAPMLGRSFTPEDGEPGAAPVAVLSHEVWQDRFGADPGILGTTIVLGETPHTVVGVTSPDFYFRRTPYDAAGAKIFVPFRWGPEQREWSGGRWLFLVGRLAQGTTLQDATQELRGLFAQRDPEHAATAGTAGPTLVAESYARWELGEDHTTLLLFGGAAGLVLMIVCANVLILLLARHEARLREFGVRAALGAGRGRLTLSFMGEAVVSSALGGVLGVLLASWGVEALAHFFGSDLPRAGQIDLHVPVLTFAALLAIAAGPLLGLLSAFQLTPRRLIESLRRTHMGGVRGRSRLRSALVVGQFALTLTLVAGAGLLLNSFWRLLRVELGVDAERVLAFDVYLPSSRYQEQAAINAYYRSLLEGIEGLPKVESVALADVSPFEHRLSASLSPADNPELESPDVMFRSATPEFFRTVGLPLLAGRVYEGALGSSDTEIEHAPVLLSQAAARHLFPQADPVGKLVRYGEQELEVVGIVADVREFGAARPPTPALYYRALNPGRVTTIMARVTDGDPLALAPAMRGAVRRLDPAVSMYDMESLDQQAAGWIDQRRSALSLLGTFAAVALLLASLGVYSVLAYTVARRTRELGLRIALGADPVRLVRQVLGHGLALTAAGLAIGLAGALALGRFLRGMLWEVSATDPLTLAAVIAVVTAVLLASAMVACLVPARRAAVVDPLVALREE